MESKRISGVDLPLGLEKGFASQTKRIYSCPGKWVTNRKRVTFISISKTVYSNSFRAKVIINVRVETKQRKLTKDGLILNKNGYMITSLSQIVFLRITWIRFLISYFYEKVGKVEKSKSGDNFNLQHKISKFHNAVTVNKSVKQYKDFPIIKSMFFQLN